MNFWAGVITGMICGACLVGILVMTIEYFRIKAKHPFIKDWGPPEEKP